MRIAIVGAGVSGLVAAHELHPDHEVTVFEAADYPGGHTHTIDVRGGARDGGDLAVDTGFIVFNDRTYPNFERLLLELGVAWQDTDMSFGVSDDDGTFEYATNTVNSLFATRSNLVRPAFYRLLADIRRFNREGRLLLASDESPSLAHWLTQTGFSDEFVERLIVPQVAAVWSADPAQMDRFPARFLLKFFANHGLLSLRDRPQWRTVQGGSRTYVDALIAPWRDRLRLSTSVHAIERDAAGVTIVPTQGEAERFDHVILATHADRSLQMLDEPSEAERHILGAFAYQPNEVVLHTDTALLPRRRRAWASWNYHLLDEPSGLPTVTYDMNRLQRLDVPEQYCVTLNRTEMIDPRSVIGTYAYDHPQYSEAAITAQDRWAEVAGPLHTHYCGAYWGWGFHEDGVVSGLRVARDLQAAGLLRAAAA